MNTVRFKMNTPYSGSKNVTVTFGNHSNQTPQGPSSPIDLKVKALKKSQIQGIFSGLLGAFSLASSTIPSRRVQALGLISGGLASLGGWHAIERAMRFNPVSIEADEKRRQRPQKLEQSQRQQLNRQYHEW